MNISVIGSGAWGTALSLLLIENGNTVTLWSHFESESEAMRKTGENPYLPGVSVSGALTLTNSLSCAETADAIVLATPSFAVRETAARLAGVLKPGAPIVSVAKGIERESLLLLSDVIARETGGKNPIIALSGPSHAEEVGRKIPTGLVAASRDIKQAEFVQDMFKSERLRVYATDDIVGVELAGALKNVIALGAGCCDGMGFGDNTLAMLMTRGLAEIARLGTAAGGRRETFAGLAGMGDLIVTCTSRHSRNRRAGVLIGRGVPPREAMAQIGSVVEGYYAARAGSELAGRYGVEMPITEATCDVLYNNAPLRETFTNLMTRSSRHELEENWVTIDN